MMKKVFVLLALSFMTMGAVNAQDLESLTNAYNSAAATLSDGNNQEALNMFNKALDAATALGEEGADILQNCKEIIPKILLSMGKDAASSNSFDEAANFFKQAAAKATEYANNAEVISETASLISQVMMAKGSSLLNAKKYKEAADAYQAIIDSDASNGVAYLRKGMALAAEGSDADAAVEALTKAVENGQADAAKKQLATLYLKKAVACQKDKDMKGMLENAQLSAENNDSANAQKLIGTAALSLKQNKLAAEAFEAYLALNPNAADKAQTIYQIGTALMNAGDNAKACSYFKQIKGDAKWGEAANYYVTTLKCS
ncbi:MAG: tetratricopeptide repeat protein [Bacteroidales bacterium]|nr:tetratricopeptide repeat protein [Bacteroidales bacterium]